MHLQICEVASKVTESDLSTETPMHGESVTKPQTSINSKDKINASTNEQHETLLQDGLYTMNVQWDYGSYDLASFFCNATYRIQTSVSISSKSMLTVARLVLTGISPNLVNKNFLPLVWRKSVKTIRSPPLHTLNCEVVSVDGIVPLFVHLGDLRVCTWFGVVDNLAVNLLLGTSFIDPCIGEIFPTERKVVPRHSRPVAITSTQKKVNKITADTEEVDVHAITDSGTRQSSIF